MINWDMMGIYLSAALAIMVFSHFLYKDNPFFHIAEHAAIGVALGNSIIVSLKSIYDVALTPAIKGQNTALWIFAVIFTALILVRWPRKHAWISRWPLSIIVGTGMGLGFRGAIDGQLRGQILASIMPLVDKTTATPIDNLLTFAFTFPIIIYFIFTKEQKGSLGALAKWSRYAMMITFGALFGTVMMTRWSYLASRIVIILQALGLFTP